MALQTAINGNYFAFVNIEWWVLNQLIVGIKGLNYDDDLSRAKARGTLSVPVGLTRGRYDSKGSVEIYLNPALQLERLLGPGWRQVQMEMAVNYGPDDTGAFTTDIIPAFFLGKKDAAQSEGDDPLTRKYDLIIPGQILWDGVPSVIEPAAALAIG